MLAAAITATVAFVLIRDLLTYRDVCKTAHSNLWRRTTTETLA